MTVSVKEAITARDDLLWVAAHWYDLRARLRPQGGTKTEGVRAGAPTSRPPIDIHVSALLQDIEQHTRFLAQVLLDETHDYTPTTSTMPGLLTDVADRYGHFTIGDDKTAADFCAQAAEYRRKVTGTLTKPPAPDYMGGCPSCGADIYRKNGHLHIDCTTCGHTTTVEAQREHVAQRLAERLMTKSQLVSALTLLETPVPFQTIHSWARRGRLPQVGHDANDRPLFRLNDALDLATERRPRHAEHAAT